MDQCREGDISLSKKSHRLYVDVRRSFKKEYRGLQSRTFFGGGCNIRRGILRRND